MTPRSTTTTLASATFAPYFIHRCRCVSGPVTRLETPKTVTIDVTSPRLAPNNFDVPAGTTFRWRFEDELKHDITVADAPFGFSSQPLSAGRSYRRTLTRPGAYKLFCSLHPVAMTQRIDVR